MATVLIVDDEPDILLFVRVNMEMDGHEVITAANGEEALELVRQRHPDVIVLDVMMPKLDGLAVVDQLRHESKDGVLAHTYLLAAGQIDRFAGLPVRGIIGKPFDVQTLLAETADCIGH